MLHSMSITSSLSSVLLFTSLVSAVNLDCSHIRADGKKFDLSKLGGPHAILVQDTEGHPAKSNTTWTIDICQKLTKPKGAKDQPDEDWCPSYTRVCGVTKSWNPFEDPDVLHPITEKVIPVAGEFSVSGGGGSLDPTITRLKSKDSDVEGVDIELHGGRFDGRKQKAVVSFICDKDVSGNEGNESDDKRRKRDKDDEKDGDDKDNGDRYVQDPKNSLQFVSYQFEEDGKNSMDVLRLKWKTKYACEEVSDDDDDKSGTKKASWGFFTWFILILFLGIAAYLIFGSWINYNRYGARGWDLLPHGDTIRDIPYLFKDWSRKVVETVTGGSSRGGYSAV